MDLVRGRNLLKRVISFALFVVERRQYKRFKVVKENFFGIISIPSKEIGEYVLCQSCFKAFPPKVLDAGLQLKMKIEEGALPPANMLNIWHDAYVALGCEDLIANKTGTVEVISGILFTMVRHMQKVGVKLRLEELEDARKYLHTILNLGLEWQETNIEI